MVPQHGAFSKHVSELPTGMEQPDTSRNRRRSVMTNRLSAKARWQLSVFLSRWRNRLRYAIRGPAIYRNWWEMYLINRRSQPTVLELRNGTRYWVRPRTTDLGVINEAAILNAYLGPGYFQLQRDAAVVDVGANIGDFSIQAAKLCPAGLIYAVEPVSANLKCLQRQLELNGTENVVVIPIALGGQEGQALIHASGGHSSLYWGSAETEVVNVTTLQSLMAAHGIERIDLLKLDCEGAEWDILPAAECLLPRIRAISMEYHNGKLDANWLELWLRQHDFEVRRTSGQWNGHLWAWQKSIPPL